MTWSPLHDGHAIERVRFEVQFSEPLPRKLVEILGLKLDEQKTETRFERQDQTIARVTVGPMGTSFETGASVNEVGWLAVRTATKHNLPVEAVSVQNSALAYESSDYRGWTKAFARYQSVCGPLLEQAGQLVAAASVSLEYTDRFLFLGPAEKAAPSGVLAPEILALLPDSALSGRELWHVHRGWYETLGGHKCLVNQNCEAHEGTTPHQKLVRSIQIYTKCDLKLGKPGIEISDATGKLHEIHGRSKSIVSSAIVGKLAQDIGLVLEA